MPAQGLPELNGALVFGIGTRVNNQPPAEIKVFATNAAGEIKFILDGKLYSGAIDSGNQGYQLPADLKLENCLTPSFLLCPKSNLLLKIEIEGQDGLSSSSYRFQIQNANAFAAELSVFKNVGVSLPGNNQIMLGAPFFFDRTVFFGMPGKASPLGLGPFDGATGL